MERDALADLDRECRGVLVGRDALGEVRLHVELVVDGDQRVVERADAHLAEGVTLHVGGRPRVGRLGLAGDDQLATDHGIELGFGWLCHHRCRRLRRLGLRRRHIGRVLGRAVVGWCGLLDFGLGVLCFDCVVVFLVTARSGNKRERHQCRSHIAAGPASVLSWTYVHPCAPPSLWCGRLVLPQCLPPCDGSHGTARGHHSHRHRSPPYTERHSSPDRRHMAARDRRAARPLVRGTFRRRHHRARRHVTPLDS